jgi:hypothetical protein
LNESLLDDPRRLVRRDGFATFEGPGAGATGQQEGQREPGAKKGGEVVHGGRLPLARAPNLEPRIPLFIPRPSAFGLRTLNSALWTLDFRL